MTHPAIAPLLRWFDNDHMAEEHPAKHVATSYRAMAYRLAEDLPPSAELTAGLRKLLEAKDCHVRAALEAAR